MANSAYKAGQCDALFKRESVNPYNYFRQRYNFDQYLKGYMDYRQ